jgi:hypothetical protein
MLLVAFVSQATYEGKDAANRGATAMRYNAATTVHQITRYRNGDAEP